MDSVGCWSPLHTDCDDTRRDVSPHTLESRCDGIDDDCDGRVDERGADADGDGYFVPDCLGEPDCLDSDPAVHPGATELCWPADWNCDGRHPDADGDRHVALDDACVGGGLPRDDCDDGDGGVWPGARELCNGVDDDCDGVVDGLSAYCYAPRAARTECRDARCLHVVCAAGWGACEVPLDCTTQISSEERHCGACDSPCRSGGCSEGVCRPFDALALATTGTYGLLGSTVVRLERSAATDLNSSFLPATAIGGGARLCWGGSSVRCDGWPIEGMVPNTRVISSSVVFACAVTSRAEAWCWGAGPSGELGDGALHPSAVSAVRVSGIVYATTITTGEQFACAIDTHESEAVWCWGDGALGTLGNGATSDSTVPVPVALSRSVVALTSGQWHACALARDGSVWCWGQNRRGQLGATDVSDFTSTPREVVGLPPVTAIAAAGAGTCALTATGERWCWGANDAGQLGDGTRVDRTTPTLVETGIRRLWLGPQHGCAETAEGMLQCWGENDDGRLGDGTSTDSLVPVVVDYAP
jgi:alpha-tubulin suppressor-like RCC1 family protein